MTLQEIMANAGLDENAISAVIEEMKKNKIFTASEENLDTRYGKLKDEHKSSMDELGEANKLIDTLKKSNEGNDELQQKVTEYEKTVTDLQAQLAVERMNSAIKVELLESKAKDVDYLTYKLKEKGEMKLKDDGTIDGWEGKLNELKAKFPDQFESAKDKKIEEHKLEGGSNENQLTREKFNDMNYNDRLKLYNENPDAYKEMTKE